MEMAAPDNKQKVGFKKKILILFVFYGKHIN